MNRNSGPVVTRYRREVLEDHLLRVNARLQNADGSQHLVAASLHDEGHLLEELETLSRDFC